ncbi:hypothetical protein TSMEX_003707 [Taenia solium]|eukprot:TsM_000307500 transcript=TsM_000307500 gene=TsM_000307500
MDEAVQRKVRNYCELYLVAIGPKSGSAKWAEMVDDYMRERSWL